MVLDAAHFAEAPKTILTRAPLVPRGVLAALGVGAAFGLGIVVGGGMGTARGQTQDSHATVDVLQLAHERSLALEEKRAQIRLTYAAELQKADAPLTARPVEKQLAPGTTLATATATPATTASSASGATTSPPETADDSGEALEPPPAPAPEPSNTRAAENKAEDTAENTDEQTADNERARGAATESGEPPVAALTAEKVDPARLQQALAKVLGDAPTAVDARPVARAFALQVASAPNRAGAEELSKKLAAQGHEVRVIEGDVGGKAVFRVRVGRFQDRASADSYKAKLSTPAFIVGE